jgi:hypothetical protein
MLLHLFLVILDVVVVDGDSRHRDLGIDNEVLDDHQLKIARLLTRICHPADGAIICVILRSLVMAFGLKQNLLFIIVARCPLFERGCKRTTREAIEPWRSARA